MTTNILNTTLNKFRRKTKRKTIEECQHQSTTLINTLETASQLFILNPYPPNITQDIKYLTTLEKKIKITEEIIKIKLEEHRNQLNQPPPTA